MEVKKLSLPGVTTVIRDRFYTMSRTEIPVGPRIVAIGKRSTADKTAGISDLDPYNASNESNVIDAFGAESQLHRAYLELVSGGATRVTLIALPSDTAYNHTNGTISSAAYTLLVGSNTLFDDAFSAAESVRADIIVPWGRGADENDFEDPPATPDNDNEIGFYADNDDGAASWALKIATKCAEITNNSHPCFAILGVKPYQGASGADGGMTPANVNNHTQLPNLIARDDVLMGAVGIYVSIVAAEVTPLGYNRNYDFGFSNGACMYAGHISQLDSWSAPTGKPVFNTEKLRYNPTRTQQLAMVADGVVSIALNFDRRATWIDAQTFGKLTSDYVRLTTLRIVFDAVQMVRQVAQQFIGEATNVQSRNALETAVTAGLRGMQQVGAVLASDFTVTYIPAENKAIIDLVLNPAFELRNLEVRVSVQL